MAEIGFNDRFDNLIIGLANSDMWFLTKPAENQYRFASFVSDIRGFNFSIVFAKQFSLCNIHNEFSIIMHKDWLRKNGEKIPISYINIYNRSANLRNEIEYFFYVKLWFVRKELFRC